MKVSLPQVLTALSAVTAVGFEREEFYWALESTLVCEQVDRPLFKRLFMSYFSPQKASNRRDERGAGEAGDGEDIDIAPEDTHTVVNPSKGFREQKSDRQKIEEILHISPIVLLAKAVRENDYHTLHYLAELGVRSLGKLKREDAHRVDELVDKAEMAIGWFDVVGGLIPF